MQFFERRSAGLLYCQRARLHQGIIGRGERQFINHQHLQSVARNVHAFPKRGGRDQDAPSLRRVLAIRTCTVRSQKIFNQSALGILSLHQYLDACTRQISAQRLGNGAHSPQRGGQHHRAATQNPGAFGNQRGDSGAVV